jgi:hypothetical protein
LQIVPVPLGWTEVYLTPTAALSWVAVTSVQSLTFFPAACAVVVETGLAAGFPAPAPPG